MGIKQVQRELVLRTTVLHVLDPWCKASSHSDQVVSHIFSVTYKSSGHSNPYAHMCTVRSQWTVSSVIKRVYETCLDISMIEHFD